MRKILSSMMLALIMLTVSFVLTMGTEASVEKKPKKKIKATVGIEETKTAPEYQLLAAKKPAAKKKK